MPETLSSYYSNDVQCLPTPVPFIQNQKWGIGRKMRSELKKYVLHMYFTWSCNAMKEASIEVSNLPPSVCSFK
jgi:hypothetical protein